jgi:lon-related putative ATP-dependent protease
MAEAARRVETEKLRRSCSLAAMGFATSDELPDLEQVLGQARALEALEVGFAVPHEGFNLFVLGPRGTGRHFVVRDRLERAAAELPPPADWAYVQNFQDAHRPRALRLPAGRGAELRRDMEALVEDLQTALANAFEGEDYQTRRQVVDEEIKEREQKAFAELGERAEAKGLAMLRTPLGVAFAPARQGEVMSPQDFQALPEEEKQRLERDVTELRVELEKLLRQMPRWQRERRERLRKLNREMARFAVGPQIGELRERYRELPDVVTYLEEVEADVVRHAHAFVAGDASASDETGSGAGEEQPTFRRYRVNLLVDSTAAKGAPVIFEDHPSYQNLCGRVEHLPRMGVLVTDFMLITPGALHRANGGFLMLDALEVLRQPFAWDALKRALVAGKLRIESLAQSLSLVSTVSLEPEPIALDLKVVLVGERLLYYLLSAYDPDFPKLFKIAADFDDRFEWSAENEELFARFAATLARRAGLAPFERAAVERVVEEAARRADDAARLSLVTARLRDLLCEADHWRQREGRATVAVADVERAVAARERRAGRLRERLLEETLREVLRISTTGERVGQVNGLTVLELGDSAFGHPARISARARVGVGEVVNIEREVELSGPIHSKGVLILSGFLGERYAAEMPLSLAASLVFEQSYGGVEGDSASLAELCALLSAISEIPLRQSIAMTGSVDQQGNAQAVGGVNEKIEGFYDLCAARGLDGLQGVILPGVNVQHLMLRRDVVEAVAAGRFHVWEVDTVDRAMELLTGLPAGERDADGSFPEGSVNARVAARLAVFAEKKRAFAGGEKNGEEGE